MKYFNNKQQAYKRNKVLNRRDADNLIGRHRKMAKTGKRINVTS